MASYIIACVASSLNGKTKVRRALGDGSGREMVLDMRACVCNGSYIGDACCRAPDRIAWEGVEGRLLMKGRICKREWVCRL